jgi:hypothetical protein
MCLERLADPERFERPTLRFVVSTNSSAIKGRADDLPHESGIGGVLAMPEWLEAA